MSVTVMPESQDWQLNKSLQECTGYMFDNQIACDVDFLVGMKPVDQEKIGAHKFILIARSPVFLAMLCSDMQDLSAPIEIVDIEPDAFKQMLRFLYRDDLKMTADLVLPTLYAAKKYMVPKLADMCVQFLEDSLSPDNVGVIYEQSLFYDEKDLVKKCSCFIETRTEDIFKSSGILEVSRSTLSKILEFEILTIGELNLFCGCLKWAEAECARLNLQPDPDNIRKVLGDALYLIRFPTMELSDFATHVCKARILTAEEKCSVFEYMTVEECDQLCDIIRNLNFPTTYRQRPMPSILKRFTAFGKSNVYSGDCSIMKVQPDKPILFKGIGVLGSTSYDPLTEISVTVKQDKKVLLNTTIQLSDDRSGDVIHAMFPENVIFKASMWYTIIVTFNFFGDHDQGSCRRGRGGYRCISCEGVNFDFDRADSAGFIAEILFCRV